MASYAENVSIWWRHHGLSCPRLNSPTSLSPPPTGSRRWVMQSRRSSRVKAIYPTPVPAIPGQWRHEPREWDHQPVPPPLSRWSEAPSSSGWRHSPLVHGRGFDATGFVYPGRTARQINACIRKIPLSDITVLAAGTNNIEQQTVTECTKELHQIIDNVSRKRRGKTVIMSQLPYRFDKPELCCKIDQVNDFIRKEVSRQKHWFKHILLTIGEQSWDYINSSCLRERQHSPVHIRNLTNALTSQSCIFIELKLLVVRLEPPCGLDIFANSSKYIFVGVKGGTVIPI